jgi:exopolysaccharide biosynthesis predicted pyruvyltransferase EpsI
MSGNEPFGGTLALIRSLSAAVDEILDGLTINDRTSPCALLDFPSHANVGDSAIWLGEIAWLRQRGWLPSYTCDTDTYSRECLAKSIGDGIIFLHGGGNFGDFWTNHQELRERAIQDFPGNRIIQLPQTIYYLDIKSVVSTQRVVDAHKNLILLCRDQVSLDFARQHFVAESHLCPDMAFSLGTLTRTPAVNDVVWLCRTDEESSGAALPPRPESVEVHDWLEEAETPLRRQSELLSKRVKRNTDAWQVVQRELMDTYEPLARQRLNRGCDILNRGRIVISDRLHGHVLSLLLGIPHVIYDNCYGKLRSFYETWTQSSNLTRWAETPTNALEVALQLHQSAQRESGT